MRFSVTRKSAALLGFGIGAGAGIVLSAVFIWRASVALGTMPGDIGEWPAVVAEVSALTMITGAVGAGIAMLLIRRH